MRHQYFSADEIPSITEDNLQEILHQKLVLLGVARRYDLRIIKKPFGTIEIQRDLASFEGPRCRKNEINLGLKGLEKFNFDILDHEINRLYRKSLREIYLEKCNIADNTPNTPRHCHTMNSLQKSMIRHADLDPMLFLTKETNRPSFVNYIKEKGLVFLSRKWEDGRLYFYSLKNEVFELRLSTNHADLIVEKTLPEAVMLQCVGKYIQDIIDHPSINNSKKSRISEVYTNDNKTHFKIEDKEEYLGKNFSGIKRNWLSVPFNQQPTD